MIRAEDEMRYPPEASGRRGFKNFTWSMEAVRDWEEVWDALWACEIKWEWQNTDRYARRRGKEYNLFVVHNDAARLDMAFPLPEINAIKDLNNWLLGAHIDNNKASTATNLIRKWIKNYVE